MSQAQQMVQLIRAAAVGGAQLKACWDAQVTDVRPDGRGGWFVYMTGTIVGEQHHLLGWVTAPENDPVALSCESCIVLR